MALKIPRKSKSTDDVNHVFEQWYAKARADLFNNYPADLGTTPTEPYRFGALGHFKGEIKHGSKPEDIKLIDLHRHNLRMPVPITIQDALRESATWIIVQPSTLEAERELAELSPGSTHNVLRREPLKAEYDLGQINSQDWSQPDIIIVEAALSDDDSRIVFTYATAERGDGTARGWWHVEKSRLSLFPLLKRELLAMIGPTANGTIPQSRKSEPEALSPQPVLTEIQRKIMALLIDDSFTGDALAQRLKDDGCAIERRAVAEHLRQLKKNGLIKNKGGVGYYRPDRPPLL